MVALMHSILDNFCQRRRRNARIDERVHIDPLSYGCPWKCFQQRPPHAPHNPRQPQTIVQFYSTNVRTLGDCIHNRDDAATPIYEYFHFLFRNWWCYTVRVGRSCAPALWNHHRPVCRPKYPLIQNNRTATYSQDSPECAVWPHAAPKSHTHFAPTRNRMWHIVRGRMQNARSLSNDRCSSCHSRYLWNRCICTVNWCCPSRRECVVPLPAPCGRPIGCEWIGHIGLWRTTYCCNLLNRWNFQRRQLCWTCQRIRTATHCRWQRCTKVKVHLSHFYRSPSMSLSVRSSISFCWNGQ